MADPASATRPTAPEDLAGRRALLQLIAIGGAAVLGSYLLVFDPAVAGNLWGGIPEGRIRALYTLNMLLAAFGFFPASYWLVVATPASAMKRRTGVGFQSMFLAYAALLMASALWLPLTALYGTSPNWPLWLLIRLVLLIVGVAASLLAVMLARLARSGSAAIWLAVAFFFFFWLQTMVLDALVWPYYYST